MCLPYHLILRRISGVDRERTGTDVAHGLTFSQLEGIDASADALLARHHKLMRDSSPEESCHVMTAEALRASGARVHVGRNAKGDVLAIGAYLLLSDHRAEVKSMHCHDMLRGKGAGRAVLDRLQYAAAQEGVRSLWLETGSAALFAPARALYLNAGFQICPPFGDYVEDPLSVFMTKEL